MTTTSDLEQPAITGGTPAKTVPFTRQFKFDETEMQELTNRYIGLVEKHLETKEKEIMAV